MSSGTIKKADVKVKIEGESDLNSYLETFNKDLQSSGDKVYIGTDGSYYVQEAGDEIEEDPETIEEDEEGEQSGYQQIVVQGDNNSEDYNHYVLIVQGEDISKTDSQIYEFDDEERPGDDKSKIVKISPKKTQGRAVNAHHMCNYCNYTTPKRYLLARHMKSHSEDRPHKCSVCERGFKTLASLQNHVNTHTGVKPHHCKFCESCFTTSGELVRHVRYKHTHEKPHKCTECDYASVELSKLKRHIRCHTGERPYQCPHCTYASPDTFKLKRHLRIHTGEKPYECDVCHARFTQSNSLKAHKMIHSVGEKPVFQCELCPTTCGRKTDLRIHIQKLHTADEPIKCKRCGNSYPDRYTYKLHAKTHEGEKCYKCDVCPYASISARHLESHLLIHTDQKPFVCAHCDQAFRQKQLLKRHENLYHNPNYVPAMPKEKNHLCPTCDKAFRHKGNLIRHMASHDPDSSEYINIKDEGSSKVAIKTQQMSENEGEMIACEEEDGQSYVVLEVIHMDDENEDEGEESEEDVGATLIEEDGEGLEEHLEDEIEMVDTEEGQDESQFILNDENLDEDVMLTLKDQQKQQTSENMSAFFGFDTDSEGEGK